MRHTETVSERLRVKDKLFVIEEEEQGEVDNDRHFVFVIDEVTVGV